MVKFSIRVCGTNVTAYRRDDEAWQDAADRAIKRAVGRSAKAWSWQSEGLEQDHNGKPMRRHFKTTVVGKALRDGARPILGEAHAALWPTEIGDYE